MIALRCLAGAIVLSFAGIALAGGIRIQASDQDGHPVPGARVWICERDIRPNESPASAEGVTRPNGQALLTGLRPGFGRYRLVVSARDYANTVIDQVFVALEERSLSVQLVDGGRLAGRVRTETGEPVAGAKVRLQLPGWVATRDPHYLLSETTTGRDGKFALPHAGDGVHGLLAEAEGGVGWRTGVRAPADGIEIVIRPGVYVTGRAGLPSDQPAVGTLTGPTRLTERVFR